VSFVVDLFLFWIPRGNFRMCCAAFGRPGARSCDELKTKQIKVFCFFSSEKKAFLAFSRSSRAGPALRFADAGDALFVEQYALAGAFQVFVLARAEGP
jgi:hypothetical protein